MLPVRQAFEAPRKGIGTTSRPRSFPGHPGVSRGDPRGLRRAIHRRDEFVLDRSRGPSLRLGDSSRTF
jgi:hypothetical protein